MAALIDQVGGTAQRGTAGGQAQFIEYPPPEAGSLQPVLTWIEQHLAQPLSVSDIARRAAMSPRTLARRFQEQTGTTPARWVNRARVQRARHLLETSDLSISEISDAVGFGAPSTLRERFQQTLGTCPRDYRAAFRVSDSGAAPAPGRP